MKVAIVGSPHFHKDITKYIPLDTSCLIIGQETGVGEQAMAYARHRGLPLVILYPPYMSSGPRLRARDQQLVELADRLVVIQDGWTDSANDKALIAYARRQKKLVHEVRFSVDDPSNRLRR